MPEKEINPQVGTKKYRKQKKLPLLSKHVNHKREVETTGIGPLLFGLLVMVPGHFIYVQIKQEQYNMCFSKYTSNKSCIINTTIDKSNKG